MCLVIYLALHFFYLCVSTINDWIKIVNQFSHLNLGLCQGPVDSFCRTEAWHFALSTPLRLSLS